MKFNSTTLWISVGVVSLGGATYYLVSKSKKNETQGSNNRKSTSKGQKQTKDQSAPTRTLQLYDRDRPFDQEYADDVKRNIYPKKPNELPLETAKEWAKQIFDADGYFYDDADLVKDIFQRKVKNKVHVSNLSKVFYDEHGERDLWKYVAGIIGRSNMKPEIEDYIKRKPDY